jgi:protein TonB
VRTAGIEAEPEPFVDLERAIAPARPEQSVPRTSGRRGVSLGSLLSLALHLLPLLLLLRWQGAPVEVPPPIPVRLVVEQPPPPPPEPAAQPQPDAKPPRGRLASEAVGAEADEPPVHAPEEASGVPSSDSEPQPRPTEPIGESRARPVSELRQVANFLQAQNEPTLLRREALALPLPEVEPLPEKPAAPVSSRQPAPSPGSARRSASIVGPPAARDEYLAHLVTLVRPHLYLLQPELLQGRRGTISLAIRVLGDGTIARIAVSQSSGYRDIDNRVIQIVAAVGRFPPLPPWLDQPSWDINFHLRFPFPSSAAEQP